MFSITFANFYICKIVWDVISKYLKVAKFKKPYPNPPAEISLSSSIQQTLSFTTFVQPFFVYWLHLYISKIDPQKWPTTFFQQWKHRILRFATRRKSRVNFLPGSTWVPKFMNKYNKGFMNHMKKISRISCRTFQTKDTF